MYTPHIFCFHFVIIQNLEIVQLHVNHFLYIALYSYTLKLHKSLHTDEKKTHTSRKESITESRQFSDN